MTGLIDFLPLEEIDLEPNKHVIVWLKKPSSIPRSNMNRGGLVKIKNVKKLKQVECRLTKDFQSWILLTSEQSHEELDEMLGKKEIKQKTFHSPEECLRFISLHRENSVILILSPYYSQNGKILSKDGGA